VSEDKLIEFRLKAIDKEIDELKADAKEDRKAMTQVVQTMGENIVRLTTMLENQQKTSEDHQQSIEGLRENINRSHDNYANGLIEIIKGFWGKFVIALVILSLATMGVKTGVDMVKLLK
jgi:hypothetical protein